MKIRHFLYNAFLIEDEGVKIAIDPGQNLWLFNLCSLIPKKEWKTITHVLVTHGDPDHYWQADRVSKEANAPLIMNKTMFEIHGAETRILSPRRDGLKYEIYLGETIMLEAGERINVNDVSIQGLKTQHGRIEYSIFGIKQRKIPGPDERAGFGAIGFKIQVANKSIVNLGDTILLNDWQGLAPDVLLLPIGGLGNNTWTMDVTEALEAVKMINPKLVIPCHYNVPFLWIKKFAQADVQYFKQEVEKLGIACHIMQYGDKIEI
jgi:L-ascorbate metabolism protein UlaG (beta-lactamase superfamily)